MVRVRRAECASYIGVFEASGYRDESVLSKGLLKPGWRKLKESIIIEPLYADRCAYTIGIVMTRELLLDQIL